MIGLKIDKSMFFDTKKVKDAVDKGTRKVLSKFGAFVRTAAQSRIRKRRRISRPGESPSSHTGLLKKLIYFGFDAARRSVVIGPTPLRGQAEAPPLLEYGGKASRKRRSGEHYVATYRQRPFMGPAFEQEKKKLPGLWSDSVK